MLEKIVLNSDIANALLTVPNVEIAGYMQVSRMTTFAHEGKIENSTLVIRRMSDSLIFEGMYEVLGRSEYFEGGSFPEFFEVEGQTRNPVEITTPAAPEELSSIWMIDIGEAFPDSAGLNYQYKWRVARELGFFKTLEAAEVACAKLNKQQAENYANYVTQTEQRNDKIRMGIVDYEQTITTLHAMGLEKIAKQIEKPETINRIQSREEYDSRSLPRKARPIKIDSVN